MPRLSADCDSRACACLVPRTHLSILDARAGLEVVERSCSIADQSVFEWSPITCVVNLLLHLEFGQKQVENERPPRHAFRDRSCPWSPQVVAVRLALAKAIY